MSAILLWVVGSVLLALAYRGKGGGWNDWGVRSWLAGGGVSGSVLNKSVVSHAASAVFGAIFAALLTGLWSWTPVYAAAFFLGTKPDIGTGFAAYHDNRVLMYADLHQARDVEAGWSWLSRVLSALKQAVFWPADALGRVVLDKTGSVALAGLGWMLGRGLFFLPYMALIGASNGGISFTDGMLVLVLFAGAYTLGAAQHEYEQVEFSEYAMGPLLAFAAVVIAYG